MKLNLENMQKIADLMQTTQNPNSKGYVQISIFDTYNDYVQMIVDEDPENASEFLSDSLDLANGSPAYNEPVAIITQQFSEMDTLVILNGEEWHAFDSQVKDWGIDNEFRIIESEVENEEDND